MISGERGQVDETAAVAGNAPAVGAARAADEAAVVQQGGLDLPQRRARARVRPAGGARCKASEKGGCDIRGDAHSMVSASNEVRKSTVLGIDTSPKVGCLATG